ncbi:MAG: hypothetical protein K2P63_00740 [Lachnospiraceae bacterium]|nr:hypothetical protein [Lachnospiraceae bacterium]
MSYKTKNKTNTRRIYQNINRMAYPILLNYLLSSVFELLDKAIVGHYSVQGFAVVGAAASFTFAITGALGILSAAFNITAAEERGRGSAQGFETAFEVSKTLALIVGGCFFVLSLLGGRFFFQRVYKIQGTDLETLLSYFYPASFTVLLNMLIFQYSTYFRNCLNTKITLYSTVVSTCVNLFFDFSLVYGYCGLVQLGTAGAAWGSIIGLAAGLLVYQAAYFRRHPAMPGRFHRLFWLFIRQKRAGQGADHPFGFTETAIDAKAAAQKIVRLYPALFGQELLESTIFACVVSAAAARLGTRQLAVYSLLDTLAGTLGLPIYAYAAAAQTFALQSYSAGCCPAKKQESEANLPAVYLTCGMRLTFCAIAALCALCSILGGRLLYLIVDDTDIVSGAQELLIFVFLLLLARIPCQIYMNYLQGIGRERFVLRCTAVGTACASLGCMALGALFGLPGIYAGMIVELLALGFCYAAPRSR